MPPTGSSIIDLQGLAEPFQTLCGMRRPPADRRKHGVQAARSLPGADLAPPAAVATRGYVTCHCRPGTVPLGPSLAGGTDRCPDRGSGTGRLLLQRYMSREGPADAGRVPCHGMNLLIFGLVLVLRHTVHNGQTEVRTARMAVKPLLKVLKRHQVNLTRHLA